MKYFFSFGIIILTICQAAGQLTKETPSIVFRGKLTFERKLNVHRQLDEMLKSGRGNSSMMEAMKKQVPKYKTDIFEMYFNEKESLYTPARDGISESKMMMGNIPADRNVIFNDFESDSCTSQKKIFEKTYLVKDSLRRYQWKITEEFRKIAGFNCRRAETIIMDSVYVIAFYTDAIMAPGGPESFNGLPGMILGVVMPRLNVTYFATKFDDFLESSSLLSPPSKGDKTNYDLLDKKLKSSMENWGDFLQRILWYVAI